MKWLPLFLSSFLLLYACKPKAVESAGAVDTAVLSDEDTAVAPSVIEPVISPAKDTGHMVYSGVYDGFLLGKWTYDISIDANKEGANMDRKGSVITFNNDYTYKTVSPAGKVVEQGRFAYDRENTRLQLHPKDGAPSEWSLNAVNEVMIWVGTMTFGNNATQCRLYAGEKKD